MTSITPPQHTTGNNNTYANKVKKLHRITRFRNPEDEQAFVFNCVSDFKVKQYLHALKNEVGGPKNVIAASKIEENQMVVHLISKEILNEFFNVYGGQFKIESHVIKCRRLSAPKTKIMLSHVNPSIPDNILIEYIKEELKLDIDRDEVSYLRVDPSDDEFDHVISWRRQFFTTTEVIREKLPSSFLIKYENRNHRIFLTTDEFTCFKCHAVGHKAEYCNAIISKETEYNINFPDLNKGTGTQFSSPLTDTSSNSVQITELHTNEYSSREKNLNENMDVDKTPAPKRPLSDSSTATRESKKSEIKHIPKKNKKAQNSSVHNTSDESGDDNKPLAPRTLKEIFEPVEKLLKESENSDIYPISVHNLAIFIDMCSGSNAQNAPQMAEQWEILDTKVPSLITMLQDVHKLKELNSRSTKIKITKIINKLQESLKQNENS